MKIDKLFKKQIFMGDTEDLIIPKDIVPNTPVVLELNCEVVTDADGNIQSINVPLLSILSNYNMNKEFKH